MNTIEINKLDLDYTKNETSKLINILTIFLDKNDYLITLS